MLIKLIIISLVLVGLAILGLATQIVLKKGGQFPKTHVHDNAYLKKKGVTCIKSFDKMEQEKVRSASKFKNLKVAMNKK